MTDCCKGDMYLPTGRSYRLMFVLNSPNTGSVKSDSLLLRVKVTINRVIRLLSSPNNSSERLQIKPVEIPYEVVSILFFGMVF